MNSSGHSSNILRAINTTLKYTGKIDNYLSVGSGDGTEMTVFNEQGIDGKGIDGNEQSVERCKGLGFDVTLGDMHQMPFKDGEFNLVFSRDVFEHAYSHLGLMEEMTRVSNKYISITLPDQSWGGSEWHSLIPTTEQMIYLGMKFDLSLKMLDQFFSNGVFQSTYLFVKNEK